MILFLCQIVFFLSRRALKNRKAKATHLACLLLFFYVTFRNTFSPLFRLKDLWVRAKDPGRQAIFCLIKIKKGYAREAKSFSLSCQRWWWWRRRRSTKTPSDHRRRRLRKFDNEDKCLSFAGAWPVAKKFVMQIFTLIMPIKSMISALHQSNKHFSDCQKVFPNKPMNEWADPMN